MRRSRCFLCGSWLSRVSEWGSSTSPRHHTPRRYRTHTITSTGTPGVAAVYLAPRTAPPVAFPSRRTTTTMSTRLLPRPFRQLARTSPLRRMTAGTPPPPSPPSLSARLKSLSKEYGYSALGVYLALSALDFPFCFLAVRTIGSDRIGEYEEAASARVRGWYNSAVAPAVGLPSWRARIRAEGEAAGERDVRDGKASALSPPRDMPMVAALTHAGIWTELALAYAIHKSFIFVRVPLTAAVTPKVVKTLRGWGWDIGRKGAVGSPLEKAVRKLD